MLAEGLVDGEGNVHGRKGGVISREVFIYKFSQLMRRGKSRITADSPDAKKLPGSF